MRYLAPEVTEGEPATERSDLYSAGAVLREVAGEALGPLIGALTDPDPQRRPASAADALAALDEGATTRRPAPATAVHAGRERAAGARGRAGSERAGEALRRADELIRRPWFPAAAAILGILALAVIVIALAGGGDTQPERAAATPAPASAPLDEQLRGLDRAIDAAASRGR
jgi:hypothetical protein